MADVLMAESPINNVNKVNSQLQLHNNLTKVIKEEENKPSKSQ